MLDARAFLPFLYDPSAMSLLQQGQGGAGAGAGPPGQSPLFSNPAFMAAAAAAAAASAKASQGSFRIHDLIENAANNANRTLDPSSAIAQMMAMHHQTSGSMPQGSSGQTGVFPEKANSSGENDSLLDDSDNARSSLSPRSSSETPHANVSSSSSSSGPQAAGLSASGGPMHGKKARKARTIFTDKQLQELETTFERQKYLSVQDRVDLAHRMGLTDTQVKTWYQNRRTKWKRQAAVGVDLLQEASNVAAVHNLLRTNPYWASYFANSVFAQQRLYQAGLGPQTSGAPGPGAFMLPPGLLSPFVAGQPAFPPTPQMPSSNSVATSPDVKKASVAPSEAGELEESSTPPSASPVSVSAVKSNPSPS